jgi:curved DNA-binding protein CbpA
MIGRHRGAGVWVCSCMGFRSVRRCKHLQSAWHVLVAVDEFDGIATGTERGWPIDFGVPWLPLPDDDIFYARFPHVAVGQRPFGSDSYPQYDLSEGRGSRAEWAKVSEEILAKFGVRPEDYTTYAKQHDNARARPNSKSRAKQARADYQRASSSPPRRDPLIEALGISEVPHTLAEFKTAARKRYMETHPDRGGSAEAFRIVYAAYEALALRVFGVKV